MTTLSVIARPGIRVPREENSRRYITDGVAVDIELTTYYRRRLRDEDLLPAARSVPAQAQAVTTGASHASSDVTAPLADKPYGNKFKKED